jgi:hypothetical protein
MTFDTIRLELDNILSLLTVGFLLYSYIRFFAFSRYIYLQTLLMGVFSKDNDSAQKMYVGIGNLEVFCETQQFANSNENLHFRLLLV